MKKTVFVILLIAFVSISINCGRRGLIMGKIVDKENDTIIGALVTTDPPTISVLTTDKGYMIKNVKKGTYTITCKKAGYKPSSVEVEVTANQKTNADIQIKKK